MGQGVQLGSQIPLATRSGRRDTDLAPSFLGSHSTYGLPYGPVGKIRVKTCHIAVLVKFLVQLRSEFSIVMVPGPETMGTA